MSPELTVRRDDAPDLTGDTVRFDGDELVVLGRAETVRVKRDDVRSIIAGRPADPDDPATDEGVVLCS